MKILPITTVIRFDKQKQISNILDFTGKYYFISDTGQLFYKNQELISIKNNSGYVINSLKDTQGKKHYILRHQLVAQYFLIDSYVEGYTVDHINNIREDNRVENLRWANQETQAQNQIRRKTQQSTIINVEPIVQKIVDQKEYFINNKNPNFNKDNYTILFRLYKFYSVLVNDNSDDQVIKSYIKWYKSKFTTTEQLLNRQNFYTLMYDKAKNYKKDCSLFIAINRSIEDINLYLFEELFLHKPYKKIAFKQECEDNFILPKEIFRNQFTINAWLNNLGYTITKQSTIERL